MSSISGDRSDFRELKEVIKEFLSYMDFAYNFRLQKQVFYGELWCLNNYGKRLTDADFKPYFHGSFSEDIETALEEMRADGEVEYVNVEKQDGWTFEYKRHETGGRLSPGKKEIIKEIYGEVRGLKSKQLAQLSKQNWLFRDTEMGESMDFDRYLDEGTPPTPQLERLSARIDVDKPVGDINDSSDLESLLTE